MDIADVDGDREGGVRTLPVLLGRDMALGLAAALLTAGVGAAGVGIVEGEPACWGVFGHAGVLVGCEQNYLLST